VITALKSTRVAKLTKHEVVHRSVAVVFCFLCLLATSMIVGGVCVGQQKRAEAGCHDRANGGKGRTGCPRSDRERSRAASSLTMGGQLRTRLSLPKPSQARPEETGARRRRRKIRFRRFAGSPPISSLLRSGLHRSIDGVGDSSQWPRHLIGTQLKITMIKGGVIYRYGHKFKRGADRRRAGERLAR